MTRLLRLQAGWRFVAQPDGILLVSMVANRRIALRGSSPELVVLFSELSAGIASPPSLSELAGRAQLPIRVVEKLIAALVEQGIVLESRPALTTTDGLYDRQQRFLDFFERPDIDGAGLNERLQDRTVLMVGLGGYGTWLMLLLARQGIRNLIGVDPDRVELSNLPRQILYRRSDVGSRKIDACERVVSELGADDRVRFRGYARFIHAAADLEPLLDDVDLVIYAFGYQPTQSLMAVATACGRTGTPSLLLGASCVGTLTVPGVTACYSCLLQVPALADVVHAHQTAYARPDDPSSGVFGARIGATCAVATWEASRFLSGCDRARALDGLITLDTITYTRALFEPVPRNPECPTCAQWTAAPRTNVRPRESMAVTGGASGQAPWIASARS